MYSVLGKVAAIAGSVAVAGTRPAIDTLTGLRPLPGADPEPAAPAPLESLDTIGREHETVRGICRDVRHRVTFIETLGKDLDGLFAHVEDILGDFERTRSELAQREAVLAMVQQELETLRASHARLAGEHDRLTTECGLLRPENHRLLEKLRAKEERLESYEAQWADMRQTYDAAQGDLASERARASYLADEVEGLRAELERSDALVSTLQVDIGEARFKLTVAEESIRGLQGSLAESHEAQARAASDQNGLNAVLATERQRFAAAEALAQSHEAELARARGEHQDEVEALRSTLADLQSRHDNVQHLKEMIERTLAETRTELQARTDELRGEERRTRIAIAAASVVEKKLQAEGVTHAELQERITELDRNRQTLVAQIKPLLKTIEEKNAAIEGLEAQLASSRKRLDDGGTAHAAEQTRLEAAVRDLTTRLEDEKARRALAEGALEEDRRARVELQLAASAAKVAAAPEARRAPAATAAAKRPPARSA